MSDSLFQIFEKISLSPAMAESRRAELEGIWHGEQALRFDTEIMQPIREQLSQLTSDIEFHSPNFRNTQA